MWVLSSTFYNSYFASNFTYQVPYVQKEIQQGVSTTDAKQHRLPLQLIGSDGPTLGQQQEKHHKQTLHYNVHKSAQLAHPVHTLAIKSKDSHVNEIQKNTE